MAFNATYLRIVGMIYIIDKCKESAKEKAASLGLAARQWRYMSKKSRNDGMRGEVVHSFTSCDKGMALMRCAFSRGMKVINHDAS